MTLMVHIVEHDFAQLSIWQFSQSLYGQNLAIGKEQSWGLVLTEGQVK